MSKINWVYVRGVKKGAKLMAEIISEMNSELNTEKLTITYSTEPPITPPPPAPEPSSITSIQTKWLGKQLYQAGIKPMVEGNFVIESVFWQVPMDIRIVGFEMNSHVGFVDIASAPFVEGIVDSQVDFSKGLYSEPDKIISLISNTLRHWKDTEGQSTDSKQNVIRQATTFPAGYGIDIDAGDSLYLYVGIRNGMSTDTAAINGHVVIYYVLR